MVSGSWEGSEPFWTLLSSLGHLESFAPFSCSIPPCSHFLPLPPPHRWLAVITSWTQPSRRTSVCSVGAMAHPAIQSQEPLMPMISAEVGSYGVSAGVCCPPTLACLSPSLTKA